MKWFQNFPQRGIQVPDGFATTAFAFEEFLTHSSLHSLLYDLMLQLNKKNYSNLKEVGTIAREILLKAEMPHNLQLSIIKGYKELCGDTNIEVADFDAETIHHFKIAYKKLRSFFRIISQKQDM